MIEGSSRARATGGGGGIAEKCRSVAVAACGVGSEGSSGDLARAMRSDGFVGLTADQLREVLTRVPVNLTASVTAGAHQHPAAEQLLRALPPGQSTGSTARAHEA